MQKKREKAQYPLLIPTTAMMLTLGMAVVACPETGNTDDAGNSGDTDGGTDTGSEAGVVSVAECESLSALAKTVCLSEAFLASLSDDQKASVFYEFSDTAARTGWSNLPTNLVQRNGLRLGDLSTQSQELVEALAAHVLSTEGYTDWVGVRAADEYLAEQGGAGGPQGGGLAYGSAEYYIAFLGTPSTTEDWMLQLGGHHMAFNITYVGGVGYPVPNHIGSEPKSNFTLDAVTYGPLLGEGDAWVSLFGSLDATQVSDAYLAGQTFADVLVGPDNNSGTQPDNYPTGNNRSGVLVSTLSDEQKSKVIAVIRQWVADYGAEIADPLIAEYTSEAAFADTYVAWAGSENAGPDVDTQGTYFRIDGPRLWIEVACQGGIVIQGETHFHTIYRDKLMDYGGNL